MAYIKEERYDEQTTAAIAEHYKEILRLLGEDPDREGLKETPDRVARMYEEIFEGMNYTNDELAKFTMIPGGGMHLGLLFEMDVTNRWGFDAAVMYELRTMRWGVGYNNDSISNTFKRQLGCLIAVSASYLLIICHIRSPLILSSQLR